MPSDAYGITYETADNNGTKTTRSVFFANNRSYVLDVHSKVNIYEAANGMLNKCTTFYMGDYNRKVTLNVATVFGLALAFILLCLLFVYLWNRWFSFKGECLNRTAKGLVLYSGTLLAVNIGIALVDLIPLYNGKYPLDAIWWGYYVVMVLTAMPVNVMLSSAFIVRSKQPYSYDFLMPQWLKRFLISRKCGLSFYNGTLYAVIWPMYLIGCLPFGACVMVYVLPALLFVVVVMEVNRLLYAPSKDAPVAQNSPIYEVHVVPQKSQEQEPEMRRTGFAFKDYYLLLDLLPNDTEEDLEKAFQKAMARCNSGISRGMYGLTYRKDIQEAYRVLSSRHHLKPLYDKEYEIYSKTHSADFQCMSPQLVAAVTGIRKELGV